MADNEQACANAAARRLAQEDSKGALLITPISLHQLENLNCPICREPYSDVPPNPKRQRPEQEWAVSIDMVAEWFGQKSVVHIMGRKCLEQHLLATGQWRNKCPLCRDIWFHELVPAHAQWQRAPTQAQPDAAVAPRRSARLAALAAARSGTLQPPIRHNDIIRVRRHQRLQPLPTHFTNKLMAALEVGDGSSEVKGTMEEVEQRLCMLYNGLE